MKSVLSVKSKDLDVSVQNLPEESFALDSFKQLSQTLETPVLDTETPIESNLEPETVNAPASDNMTAKTGGIIGVIILLIQTPAIIELVRGVPMADVLQTSTDIIQNNVWAITAIAIAFIFHKTIIAIMKQVTVMKSVETKSNPFKKSVDIIPN